MVRNYVRKTAPNKIAYMKEKPPEVSACIKLVKEKKLSFRQMASQLGISHTTAFRYVQGHDKKTKPSVGHPTVFSPTQEAIFEHHIAKLAEFGFLLNKTDLKMIVNWHLSNTKRKVPTFQNNTPGDDWINRFISRNNLSNLFTCSTARARGSISDRFSKFADHLGVATAGVPAENIFIYDEFDLSADPLKERIIGRRNCKYPEEIENPESNLSVMFCATGAGYEVPAYVIFKSDHLHSTWTHDGPPGARYNCDPRGCFNFRCFEDWFINHLFPHLENLPGKKVLIGDNLSSHITFKVLNLCEKENVHFVSLPPKSTHLNLPLDFAYFRPLQTEWKNTLLEFRESEDGRRFAVTPRDKVVWLLRTCLENLSPNVEERMRSGFRKYGICPFNRSEMLVEMTPGAKKQFLGKDLLEKDQESDIKLERAGDFEGETIPGGENEIYMTEDHEVVKIKSEESVEFQEEDFIDKSLVEEAFQKMVQEVQINIKNEI